MYLETRSQKGTRKTYKTAFLRRSYRKKGDSKKVYKETVANLSALPDSLITIIKSALEGDTFVKANTKKPFKILDSKSHGGVMAVKKIFKELEFEKMLHPRSSEERCLISATIASRILFPGSKLGTLRHWEDSTTIPKEFGLPEGYGVESIYESMDWLYKRQEFIQDKLAKKHLYEGRRSGSI